MAVGGKRITVNSSSEAATGNLGVSGAYRIGDYSGTGFGIYGVIRAAIVYARSLTDAEVDDLVAWALAKFATHSNGSLSAGVGNAVVVCDGDSLTLGTGSTGGNTYPAQLAAILGGTYTVSNKGISGQFMADMLYDRFRTIGEIDALWSSGATRNICVYFEGINEVQNGASGAQCYQRTKEYGLRRRYKGFEPITITIAAAGTASAGAETARQDMNTLLRADFSVATADPYVFLANPGVNYARALVDMAARPEFDTQADTSNTTYYDADTLHWTNTSYGLLAGHVKNAIDSTATPPAVSTPAVFRPLRQARNRSLVRR
jgi:lysophospholipase L1-like esterase